MGDQHFEPSGELFRTHKEAGIPGMLIVQRHAVIAYDQQARLRRHLLLSRISQAPNRLANRKRVSFALRYRG
jgi:hypothetical protein